METITWLLGGSSPAKSEVEVGKGDDWEVIPSQISEVKVKSGSGKGSSEYILFTEDHTLPSVEWPSLASEVKAKPEKAKGQGREDDWTVLGKSKNAVKGKKKFRKLDLSTLDDMSKKS